MINFNSEFTKGFVKAEDVEHFIELGPKYLKALKEQTGLGSDFLGWVDLPNRISEHEISEIERVAKGLQKFQTIVVVGIGGSYLGSKAVIDLFTPYFEHSQTEILFAGQNLDEDYINQLIQYLSGRNFAVIVISKSGTTLEPAVGFRLLLNLIVENYGENAIKNRVVAITDAQKGALRSVVEQYGLESFVVPDDVGGRYSVLTAVGLLPIAVAGIDIRALLNGAKNGESKYTIESKENMAIQYAAFRNALYQKGYNNEIMVYSKPKWNAMAEWWKQLYGESEGKENKGIFPVSINITTDLHSLGQYVQEGERKLMETFIRFANPETKTQVPNDNNNYDQLNYLTGKSFHFINAQAETGTMQAHNEGGVPVMQIMLEELNILILGELIYFYEIACGISGYMLGVNPFDQPGVEAYKKNMFKLLGK